MNYYGQNPYASNAYSGNNPYGSNTYGSNNANSSTINQQKQTISNFGGGGVWNPNAASDAQPNLSGPMNTNTNNNNNTFKTTNSMSQQQNPSDTTNNSANPMPMSGAMNTTWTPARNPETSAASKGAQNTNNTNLSALYDPTEFENEPPLLEELGINMPHIWQKTQVVLLPFSRSVMLVNKKDLEENNDLAGPLAFCLLLGFELILSGKIHFGYIYGFAMISCVGMGLILNLMSPKDAIGMGRVMSVLGYGLLPVNLLAALNTVLFLKNRGTTGLVLGVITIFWCTAASTRLIERSCDMRNQRYLIAYPIALVYSCFVIITVF